MSHEFVPRVQPWATLALVLASGACADAQRPVGPDEPVTVPEPVLAGAAIAEVNRDLAVLRTATAHLHLFENAAPAGWDLQVTGCKEDPALGGMGFHFGHLAFYLDGEANASEPEILLYEPQRNGRLRLVAVEYAVPFFAWSSPDPPRLFGRDMNRVDEMGEWQLHVWVWKHNPEGLFEDWNPEVTCEYAG